jgi:cation diffusion facilitator family transporter
MVDSTETLPVEERDRLVRRVILLEGSANLAVLGVKLVVGFTTGSLAVLGDAIHSLTDVANNGVAWVVMRLSAQPADREHPYGHRKFEVLAVFVLATLLSVLAVELGLGAFRREEQSISHAGWALALMLGVLLVNVALAWWENGWARRLGSDLLRADARHTFADSLTTVVVIAGWQVAARGYPGVDRLCALVVAAFVLYLAWGLFQRAVPVLVDRAAVDPEDLADAVLSVPGVRGVASVRSRSTGAGGAIDMIVRVDPTMGVARAHVIADAVEARVREIFSIDDVSVHIEPDS